MKYFYNKNKRSIWLFILVFAFLFYYDLCLITSIKDLSFVKTTNDFGLLYSLHPYLPLPRLIKGLMKIQYFDQVGFMEVIKTILYAIGSLSLVEIAFLVILLITLYDYLFNKDNVNHITFILILAHLIVFIIYMSIVSFRLYDSFVGVNETVIRTMNFIKGFSITAVIFYFIFLILSLVWLYLVYLNFKYKKGLKK